MANSTLSPNMNLIIPTVGVDPGPDWANNINSSLSIIDQHTHSPGSGIAITQNGIVLSSGGAPFDSLGFNTTNAWALRSVRFSPQSSALALGTDIGCLYESGVDLYYNDGSGNQIRITSGGSVTGATGTITGLPSGTAGASYSSGTFIFQSATNTAANIDGESFILRNSTANSKGLTLNPPNAMAANYSLTLPSIPGVTSIMQLDTSGNMSAALTIDGSTLEISSNVLQIATQGVTQGLLALKSTGSTVGAGGIAQSTGCSNFITTSTSYVQVTNLSVTITTTGRPVWVGVIGDPSETNGLGSVFGSTGGAQANAGIFRGATIIAEYTVNNTTTETFVPGCIFTIDTITAGTYTYTVQLQSSSGTALFQKSVLVAYET